MKKATIRDVAERAGVSIATVSYAVNNTKPIKNETRKRVMQAIEELNYYPDVSARTFKTGKKNSIGFIVPNISSNFFASIIEAVESLIFEKGYKLIIANSGNNEEKEIELIRLFASGLVDGLIIASAHEDYGKIQNAVRGSGGMPIVFLERFVTNCPFDSVMISDYAAITKSIDFLIAKGHKKIGFISGSPALIPFEERINAYKDTLAKYNIAYDKELVEDVGFHAFDCVKGLIENGCTALIASTNNVTNDAILYFVNKSIVLNKDVTLVGFINDDFSSTCMDNMLQVVHPIKEMGTNAVDLLFSRMENPKRAIKNIVLVSNFVKPLKGS